MAVSLIFQCFVLPICVSLLSHWCREDAIDTKIVINGSIRNLSPQADNAIFRIVQEALVNVRRHSKATKAVVGVEFAPNTVKIAVRDNGMGFSLPITTSDLTSLGKLGIAGMQQRVRFLNGTFDIRSELSRGTLVSIEVKS
jgi:signal transduction histidine kinase